MRCLWRLQRTFGQLCQQACEHFRDCHVNETSLTSSIFQWAITLFASHMVHQCGCVDVRTGGGMAVNVRMMQMLKRVDMWARSPPVLFPFPLLSGGQPPPSRSCVTLPTSVTLVTP